MNVTAWLLAFAGHLFLQPPFSCGDGENSTPLENAFTSFVSLNPGCTYCSDTIQDFCDTLDAGEKVTVGVLREDTGVPTIVRAFKSFIADRGFANANWGGQLDTQEGGWVHTQQQ